MTRTFDLLIRRACVVDADGEQGVADVGVRGGVITAVEPELTESATTEIDADGLVLLPGVVDSHVHLTDLAAHGSEGRSPAHERLARAGVTTAVEFFDFRTVLDQWHASAAGLTILGLQGLPAYTDGTPSARIRDDVGSALRDGAIGIKLLGGHFPSDPGSSARAIAEGADAGCYVAFHAGTTANGSNLDGMREALQLADGHPLHLAHTNAYLRGAVTELVEENQLALTLLHQHPEVVSEAHLAPLNLCLGGLDGDEFTDHIVVNCLRMGGYPTTRAGLVRAFADGFAHCLRQDAGQAVPVTGDEGRAVWERDPARASLCFPVNRRLSGFMQSCARRDESGTVRFDGTGEFVVDAISSDGGYWRNLVLDQGLALVQFGALSLPQLAHKTSRAPAALFGLRGKGTIAPGADADLVIVDSGQRTVRLTVAAGTVIFDGEHVVGQGGTVVTTEHGTAALRQRRIPHRVLDLTDGEFLRRGSAV
ncbi:amidohydrolase family protein [Prauserella cavernicola]|uniref:Amidohydrolase family protein n=1 Tax=Prauserella cavernicola TaxID=2800127 RepID=A0A934QUI9_9PSEU|nr:amidohydrolase family protein [Prauserella cavernicola]MBK1786527.1 amidohydrolase family protein [Prauserella cavernicola]